MSNLAAEPSVATATSKIVSAAPYLASGGALFFGLTANELAALVATSVAVLTFIVNFWFKWQHLQIVKKAAASKPDQLICEVPDD